MLRICTSPQLTHLCVPVLCCCWKCQHVCDMAYPCETSCQRGTVWGLEGLPRLQSHQRERSEALFNPAECTSHICLPALQLIHSLAPISRSYFLCNSFFCIFIVYWLLPSTWGSRVFDSFLLFSCDASLSSSLPFLSLPVGCTFHEDDFSIKCPKHEVRQENCY